MIEIISNPYNWFIAAAAVAVPLVGYVAYEAVSFHYRRKGYEPAVDLDELERELADLFSAKAGGRHD